VWLYAAAGLRFRVGVGGGGEGALGSAAVAASHLGFDPRLRAGLTDAAAVAALEVSRELRSSDAWGRGGALPRARALLRARGVTDTAASRPALTQTLTAAPPSAAVFALRSASAWYAAPAGRVGVEWRWSGRAFDLNLTLTPAVVGRVALPLAVLREVAARGSGVASVGAELVGGSNTAAAAVRGVVQLARRVGAGAPHCTPLGAVGGEEWEWCAASAGGAPAPRLVGWAEAEGEGRLRDGAPGGEDGAALWQVRGEGVWTWRVE
jgi:hypothetical protein